MIQVIEIVKDPEEEALLQEALCEREMDLCNSLILSYRQAITSFRVYFRQEECLINVVKEKISFYFPTHMWIKVDYILRYNFRCVQKKSTIDRTLTGWELEELFSFLCMSELIDYFGRN